jgi:hypothetical protein
MAAKAACGKYEQIRVGVVRYGPACPLRRPLLEGLP